MSKERELLVRCRTAINIRYDQVMLIRLHHEIEILLGEIEELLDQPEVDPFMFKDRKATGSLIAHDAMYKKGYARGFDVAREDYKQKVINAFGVEE